MEYKVGVRQDVTNLRRVFKITTAASVPEPLLAAAACVLDGRVSEEKLAGIMPWCGQITDVLPQEHRGNEEGRNLYIAGVESLSREELVCYAIEGWLMQTGVHAFPEDDPRSAVVDRAIAQVNKVIGNT